MSNSLPRIGVVGLGRLGLCQALLLDKAGFDVLGCDVFPAYVDSINHRTLTSSEPGVTELMEQAQKLRATLSLADTIAHAELIMIYVATPTGIGEHAYDCGDLSRVLDNVARIGPTDKHVVICCTVLPGYIERVGSFLLESCAGCTLSYNPEFVAQGDIVRGLGAADLVLIGEGSTAAGDQIQSVHERVCAAYAECLSWEFKPPKVCRMSPQSAEIAKLALNCFVTTKIAFGNAVADIADRTPGANKEAILNTLGSDKRIGPRCLCPGYGFGGPCLPRDNRAFGSFARSVGIEPFICEATDKANALHAQSMAQHLLKQDLERYTLTDVAFKPGCPVPVIEESQPLEVAKLLVRAGKIVVIRDRAAIIELVRRTYGRMFEYEIDSGGTDDKHKSGQEDIQMGNPLSSYNR